MSHSTAICGLWRYVGECYTFDFVDDVDLLYNVVQPNYDKILMFKLGNGNTNPHITIREENFTSFVLDF